jgi:predicted RNA-binding Zn ribbon-like protein
MVAMSVAQLPLVGGHPAIDLVNTIEPRHPFSERHDHLAVPEDLLIWSQRAGIVDAAEAGDVVAVWASSPATGSRALSAVKDTREALYAVLSEMVNPGSAPSGTELELEHLRMGWAAAANRSRLVPGHGMSTRLIVCSAPALVIPDRLAYAAVDLLCHADLARLGMCPADDEGCGWLFLDHSRNQSRRWCVMDGSCGAQVKARRLTERRRAARATGI